MERFYLTNLKVVKNYRVSTQYFTLVLSPFNFKALPGQFINVRLEDSFQPFLRRPFSIYQIKNKTLFVLYKVVGKGTFLLSKKTSGERLNVISPLGNGYPLPIELKGKQTLLVAGGSGVASLFFLAKQLKERFQCKITLFLGVKTKKDMPPIEDFMRIPCSAYVYSEDGSIGKKGLVTDGVKEFLKRNNSLEYIYGCGPRQMLKVLHKLKKDKTLFVSLEEIMACGTGICYGCAVKVKQGGYKYICKDGPVFDSSEIVWEED